MKKILSTLCLLLIVLSSNIADAHFIWLVRAEDKVEVLFSESANVAEPELLKTAAKANVWSVVAKEQGGSRLVELTMTQSEDSLSGLIAPKSQAIILSHNYGVVTKGDATFLLRYLAKQHTSPLPGQWSAVNDKEHLPLEITPSWIGRQVVMKVTWNGKPAPEVEVTVEGCGLEQTLITDENGAVKCEPTTNGMLSVRAKMVEESKGDHDGQAYNSVRTYSTLTLHVTRPVLETASIRLPALPKAITSFGAAIVGSDLYVYGGHFGSAHHYSDSGQSGELHHISLTAENPEWKVLAGGPKLTGLAMVEHNGMLYRIGGFTAKNTDDEDQNLWSQDSFASFDPRTDQWTDLPPMPSGRSSHDAAVLDGKLYVVGGWNMAGPENTTWHKTALVCDLNQPELKWTEMPNPDFERRAVSLAACRGKLFVIGGMESNDETTRKVSVFDPKTQAWSVGPELLGTGMEGFGTSSFAKGDQLLVTTMSGSIQALSDTDSHWMTVGQANEPRFFHRQLTTSDGRILLIAGASMVSGKTSTLELLQDASK